MEQDSLKLTTLLSDIELAGDLIRRGKLVAFATETVYGLGANALDAKAVARIFEAKQRPFFDPLIVHLPDHSRIEEFVSVIPQTAQALIDHFGAGPLTLVLPKRDVIPDIVTSGLSNVAIRVPNCEQTRKLLSAAEVPVAAPSANLFGSVSPTTSQHVLDGLSGRIDAVLDGGACSIGVESTVISCMPDSPPLLLRPGGLPVEEIEAVVGPVGRINKSSQSDEAPQASPGMLTKHYAPAKPFQLLDDLASVENRCRVGLLSFGASGESGFGRIENLSPSGSVVEAAANLFAAMRRLENSDVERIVAQLVPDQGLGLAINDRLRRAAATN